MKSIFVTFKQMIFRGQVFKCGENGLHHCNQRVKYYLYECLIDFGGGHLGDISNFGDLYSVRDDEEELPVPEFDPAVPVESTAPAGLAGCRSCCWAVPWLPQMTSANTPDAGFSSGTTRTSRLETWPSVSELTGPPTYYFIAVRRTRSGCDAVQWLFSWLTLPSASRHACTAWKILGRGLHWRHSSARALILQPALSASSESSKMPWNRPGGILLKPS